MEPSRLQTVSILEQVSPLTFWPVLEEPMVSYQTSVFSAPDIQFVVSISVHGTHYVA